MTKYEQLKKLIQDANPGIFKCTSRGCMLAPCFLADHRREIRLADVLLASKGTNLTVGQAGGFLTYKYENGWKIEEFAATWNLKNDNLDNQSDECKEFLIKLLIK